MKRVFLLLLADQVLKYVNRWARCNQTTQIFYSAVIFFLKIRILKVCQILFYSHQESLQARIACKLVF